MTLWPDSSTKILYYRLYNNNLAVPLKKLKVCYPNSPEYHLQTIDRFSNRIFENPIVPIDIGVSGLDCYLLLYPLLIHAHELLYRNLIYNLIPECMKTKNPKIIEDTLKNELVYDVAGIVSKFTDTYQTNVQDFVIRFSCPFVFFGIETRGVESLAIPLRSITRLRRVHNATSGV